MQRVAGRSLRASLSSASASMPNILIAEGTPATWQAKRTGFGIPSNHSLFAAALHLHRPDIRCTALNIADGEPFPLGTALAEFDGVMLPGSPLHIYDRTPAVTRQIDFARGGFITGQTIHVNGGAHYY